MGGLRPQKPQTLDLELFEPEVGAFASKDEAFELSRSLNRSLNRSLVRKATDRPTDRATERATEQKTHPESRDRPNRKTSKNRAVQGSCAHKFVQKSRPITGLLEPRFSLSPPLLRWFGGASLNRWLNDLGVFLELVFIALPPEAAMFRGAFLRLFFASFFLK